MPAKRTRLFWNLNIRQMHFNSKLFAIIIKAVRRSTQIIVFFISTILSFLQQELEKHVVENKSYIISIASLSAIFLILILTI